MRLLQLIQLCVFVAFVGAIGSELDGAELTGKVSAGSPGAAEIQIEGELVPGAGDLATIYFKLPGAEDEVVVGTGKVASVAGAVATVKLDDASVTPQKDHLARITSASPQKRSAAPAASSPSTAAAGSPAAAGNVETIRASLVGRWAGSARDGLKGTVVFKEDGTVVVPLQQTRGGFVTGKYTIRAADTPPRIVITDIKVNPPADAVGDYLMFFLSELERVKALKPDAFSRAIWVAEMTDPQQLRVQGFTESGAAENPPPLSADATRLRKMEPNEYDVTADYIPPDAQFIEVGGAVPFPSRLRSKPEMTLLEAIEAAGGVRRGADEQHVRVRRADGALSYHNLLEARRDRSLDVRLELGDRVEVPQASVDAPSLSGPAAKVQEAKELVAKGQFSEALPILNLAIATNPRDGNAYLWRAPAHGTSSPDKTIADANRALELGCEDEASAYFYRGQGQFFKKNFKAAIADETKAISLRPDGDAAYAFRAGARINTFDLKGALEDCNKALELNANSAIAYYWRGCYFWYSGAKEAAETDWKKAVALDPNHAKVVELAPASLDQMRRERGKKR